MIIPIFRIFSIQKAYTFHLDFLDFQLNWKHQFENTLPLYGQISFKDIFIYLSVRHGDTSPGISKAIIRCLLTEKLSLCKFWARENTLEHA